MPNNTISPQTSIRGGDRPAKTDQQAESGSNVDRLERYGGSVIPIVGSIMQAKYGIEEMHTDSKLQQRNGKIDLTLGAAGTVGQVASIPLYAAPFTTALASFAAIAGPLAGCAGVVGAVVDGGRDIYNGSKLGNTEDKVVGAVKIGSGLLSATGAAATVVLGASTANLPLMIAGTVIYLGAAAYQNREAISQVFHNGVEHVKNFFS